MEVYFCTLKAYFFCSESILKYTFVLGKYTFVLGKYTFVLGKYSFMILFRRHFSVVILLGGLSVPAFYLSVPASYL